MVTIPTEPIGSIPRPQSLIAAIEKSGPDDPGLDPLYEAATLDTLKRFEETGSPVICDFTGSGLAPTSESSWTVRSTCSPQFLRS